VRLQPAVHEQDSVIDGYKMSVALDLAHLRGVRRNLRSWLEDVEIPAEERDDIILATHEAVVNAIEHADLASEVMVHGKRHPHSVVIVVSNRGQWESRPRGDDARGRGLAMIRGVMSSVDIQARRGRTVIRMRKDLAG